MVLPDVELKKMLAEGTLVIEPLDLDCVQPASVDCKLGSNFLVVESNKMEIITLDSEIHYREIEGETVTIPPHSFVLATTQEYFKIPNDMVAFVEGRSSIGRIGLFVQNAGWVDPGFEGKITLELYNANSLPIKLQAGRRICQMVFHKMNTAAERPYSGKYKGQQKTVGSRVFDDKEVGK
ncbi:MAG: dCTP deaminase [Candidatus Woesearchaeota archaeon]|nr:dCTP deaminase [Candidatus Woesearchaeota archaeon]